MPQAHPSGAATRLHQCVPAPLRSGCPSPAALGPAAWPRRPRGVAGLSAGPGRCGRSAVAAPGSGAVRAHAASRTPRTAAWSAHWSRRGPRSGCSRFPGSLKWRGTRHAAPPARRTPPRLGPPDGPRRRSRERRPRPAGPGGGASSPILRIRAADGGWSAPGAGAACRPGSAAGRR